MRLELFIISILYKRKLDPRKAKTFAQSGATGLLRNLAPTFDS